MPSALTLSNNSRPVSYTHLDVYKRQVLGFAFKDIAENYIAGVLLSLRQPFSPGDSVRIDSFEGKVIALNSRATFLMTAEGHHLQLPNSVVFKSVLLNYSRNSQRRFDFQINVGSRTSLHQALDLGIATLAATAGVLTKPAPNALILNLTNDGATLQFTGWIDPVSYTHLDVYKRQLLKKSPTGCLSSPMSRLAGSPAPTSTSMAATTWAGKVICRYFTTHPSEIACPHPILLPKNPMLAAICFY